MALILCNNMTAYDQCSQTDQAVIRHRAEKLKSWRTQWQLQLQA